MAELEACITNRLHEVKAGQTVKELAVYCGYPEPKIRVLLHKIKGVTVESSDGNLWTAK